ncbi:MAG: monomethylamine:corrinoid methyltransferase [Thermoplasmata archaeon]|jgi:methylamine--corrinoid protein Co-methyltransferase|nr:monomethylamine:corrinoid methyltransferase [Thermoplasmata archaeon]
MVQILDVMEKALEGKPMSETDYQLRVFAPKVLEKVREHHVRYDPESPIHQFDSAADELFDAGLELLVDVGAYCTSTGRVISFTEGEVKEALKRAPSKLHFGEGADRKSLVSRRPEDVRPPWCLLGAGGGPCSSDRAFTTLVEGYAEIPETNAITTPAITRVGGMRIRPSSPLEILGAQRNAVLGREACNRVGRQGIPLMNTLATAESDIALAAALHPKFGLRQSDGYMICCMDPMKTDFARLNKVTSVLSLGGAIGMCFGTMLGGYAGSPEGTAVSNVAHHLMGILAYQASWLLPFPLHLRHVCSSTRDMLWVISATGQAITRNTHLLTINLNYTAAGPTTPMCLYETTASVTAAVVSGMSIESVGVATNRYEDRTTPVEPRISAEVGHAVAGMKRLEANNLANALLKKYENRLTEPPLGKTLFECWDADRRRPSKEYSQVVKRYKRDMADLGLELKPEIS